MAFAYECPQCGGRNLRVAATVFAPLQQEADGELQTGFPEGDYEWDDASTMMCDDCGETGTGKSFTLKPRVATGRLLSALTHLQSLKPEVAGVNCTDHAWIITDRAGNDLEIDHELDTMLLNEAWAEVVANPSTVLPTAFTMEDA